MVAPGFVWVVADVFLSITPLKVVTPDHFLFPVNIDNYTQTPVLPNLYFTMTLTKFSHVSCDQRCVLEPITKLYRSVLFVV